MASPSILQPILVTFHAAQIDAERAENLGEMKQELASLGKDFQIFGEKWRKLHDNVDRLQNTTNDVDKTIKRMDGKFHQISNVEGGDAIEGTEPKELEGEDAAAIPAPEDDDK